MYIARRLVHILTASLTVATVTVAAGCGPESGTVKHPAAMSSGPSPSPTPSATDARTALLAAADVMERAGTAFVALSGGMQGGGKLSWKSPQAAEITAEPNGHPENVRATADATYLQVSNEDGRYGGKGWLKLDEKTTTSIDSADGTDHLAMTGIFMAIADPVQELRAAATDNRVSVIGPERLDGNNTVRYRAQVAVDSLIAQMTTPTDDAKTRTRARLSAYGPAVTVEFWINDRGQLQQLGVAAPASSPGKAATVIGYSALHSTPAPTLPDASDTYDPASPPAVSNSA